MKTIWGWIVAVFNWIFRRKKKGQFARFDFKFRDLKTGIETYIKGDGTMAFELPVDKKVVVTLVPVDMYGNPAEPISAGVPAWSVNDPALLNIATAADGMSAEIDPTGQVGSILLHAEGDSDPGSGVTPVVGEAGVDLVAGTPVAYNMVFGTPEPK